MSGKTRGRGFILGVELFNYHYQILKDYATTMHTYIINMVYVKLVSSSNHKKESSKK